MFGIEKLNVKRSTIPAVTHVDFSARLQTIHQSTNKPYFDLITEFKRLTKCPVLVNTSFNVRGEPIVCTPKNAIECFMSTNLDALIIENFLILKNKQENKLKNIRVREFESD